MLPLRTALCLASIPLMTQEPSFDALREGGHWKRLRSGFRSAKQDLERLQKG